MDRENHKQNLITSASDVPAPALSAASAGYMRTFLCDATVGHVPEDTYVR